MRTIQTKSGELLLVKVPKDTTWWQIVQNELGEFITETLNLNSSFLQYGKHSVILGENVPNQYYVNPNNFYLPNGKWEILGKFSELEDKHFEEFLDFVNGVNDIGWRDYQIITMVNCFNSVKESFQSLCKSQGIEDDLNNYLIIKKI
jgi:hypothetical protein